MYNSDLDKLTDYPFDRLRALLTGVAAPQDREPLIMSLGEPQHPSPALLAETVNNHADQWAKYPPIAGTADLLGAAKDWLDNRYALNSDLIEATENIVVVSGTREALYMAGDVSIPPQKDGAIPIVLIPNPFYQVYIGAAVMSRAEPIYMSATLKNGFLPDFKALDETTLKRTALAYICTPSNPQGSIADIDYLKKAITLARKYDFVLAIDECYAEIYDSKPPVSILEVCGAENNLSNVLSFHSLSKRSNVPGLRAGFVAGDEELISAFRTVRTFGGAIPPGPTYAASTALFNDDEHVKANRALYRERSDAAEHISSVRFGV